MSGSWASPFATRMKKRRRPAIAQENPHTQDKRAFNKETQRLFRWSVVRKKNLSVEVGGDGGDGPLFTTGGITERMPMVYSS